MAKTENSKTKKIGRRENAFSYLARTQKKESVQASLLLEKRLSGTGGKTESGSTDSLFVAAELNSTPQAAGVSNFKNIRPDIHRCGHPNYSHSTLPGNYHKKMACFT